MRRALSLLQQQPSNLPAVQILLEAVAGSLGLVHSITAPAPAPAPVQQAYAPPAQQAYAPPAQQAYAPPAQQAYAQPVQNAQAYAATYVANAAPQAPAQPASQPQAPLRPPLPYRRRARASKPSSARTALPISTRAFGQRRHRSRRPLRRDLQHSRIGTPITLHVSMPGGYEFDADAIVSWTRETVDSSSTGQSAQPGFGAQFTQISPKARQLVYRYVRNREPLFHDDLVTRGTFGRASSDPIVAWSRSLRMTFSLDASGPCASSSSRGRAPRRVVMFARPAPRVIPSPVVDVETPHFRLHYYKGLEPVAERVRLGRRGREPTASPRCSAGRRPSVTEIVLTDDTDDANGSATALPYNTIRLFVTAPDDLSPLGDLRRLVPRARHPRVHAHPAHRQHQRRPRAWSTQIIGKRWSPQPGATALDPARASPSSRRASTPAAGATARPSSTCTCAPTCSRRIAGLDQIRIGAPLAARKSLVPVRFALLDVDRRRLWRRRYARRLARLRPAGHSLGHQPLHPSRHRAHVRGALRGLDRLPRAALRRADARGGGARAFAKAYASPITDRPTSSPRFVPRAARSQGCGRAPLLSRRRPLAHRLLSPAARRQ